MSGFITDTGGQHFDAAADWVTKDRRRRSEVGVDAAIREGVGEMMQRGGSGGYQAPMSQPWQGSAYRPPGTPAAPAQAAPDASVAAPALTPAPTPAARPMASLSERIQAFEDPSGTAINPWGYTGKHQMGTGAMKDAGMYEPSPGEDLRKNQWTGMVVSPKTGKRYTHAQFAANVDGIQDEAWSNLQEQRGREINNRGLRQHIGKVIGGMPVTEDTIRAAMQFAGPSGAQRYFDSDGQNNPSDANNVSLSRYIQRTSGGTTSPAGGSTPSVASMGLFPQGGADPAATPGQGAFNSSMNPILSRLAQTPGGGATALSVLNQQSRYDMAAGKRGDAYQRLAMQALGQGNAAVFQYYARLGGLNIPPEVVQNAGLSKRLATASLTAERIYGADPQQAAIFTQAYLRTGDVQQAFQMAGPPRSNPRISVQQVYDEHEGIVRFFGVQTSGPDAGTAAPLKTASGDALTGGTKPPTSINTRVADDGTLMVIGLDGTAKPVIGADGQPVMARSGPTSGTIVQAMNATRAAIGNDVAFMGKSSAEKDAELNRIMSDTFGAGWRDQLRGQATRPPVAAATTQYPQPMPGHIDHLRKNPAMAQDFDKKFGPGAAAKALGQ